MQEQWDYIGQFDRKDTDVTERVCRCYRKGELEGKQWGNSAGARGNCIEVLRNAMGGSAEVFNLGNIWKANGKQCDRLITDSSHHLRREWGMLSRCWNAEGSPMWKEGLGFSSRLLKCGQFGRNTKENQVANEGVSVITTVQMLHFFKIIDQDLVPASVYSHTNHLAW